MKEPVFSYKNRLFYIRRIKIKWLSMLSWALYGAAMHWTQNQTLQPEDYVEQCYSLYETT
jgi:hypothetical protein